MVYRDRREALEAQIEALEADLAGADTRRAELARDLARARAELDDLRPPAAPRWALVAGAVGGALGAVRILALIALLAAGPVIPLLSLLSLAALVELALVGIGLWALAALGLPSRLTRTAAALLWVNALLVGFQLVGLFGLSWLGAGLSWLHVGSWGCVALALLRARPPQPLARPAGGLLLAATITSMASALIGGLAGWGWPGMRVLYYAGSVLWAVASAALGWLFWRLAAHRAERPHVS